jgi:hypothetical protein
MNTLVFLAADESQLRPLQDATRNYLAWRSIVEEAETQNLTPQQTRQAKERVKQADTTITSRIPEAYRWLLVPEAPTAEGKVSMQAISLNGSSAESLARAASARLERDELLISRWAGTNLRMTLDNIPLWRDGDNVSVRQLAEDFARYLYLPRLRDGDVLLEAICDGVGLITWESEGLAYADSYDEVHGRYVGLRGGVQGVPVSLSGLVVRSEIALAQMMADAAREKKDTHPLPMVAGGSDGGTYPQGAIQGKVGIHETFASTPAAPRPLTRFYGSVVLDPSRPGRDAEQVIREVIQHLTSIVGADVMLTLEVVANSSEGFEEHTMRTVTENCRTLKFSTFGFEEG